MRKLVVAALVMIVAVAAWVLLRDEAPAPTTDAVKPEVERVAPRTRRRAATAESTANAADVHASDVPSADSRWSMLLVAGVVVDEAGRPIPDAKLRAVSPFDAASSEIVASDADGRFRIEGDPPRGDRFFVAVESDDRRVARSSGFDVGTTDARIVLIPTGVVAGSIRVPTDAPIIGLRVVVEGLPARGLGPRFSDQVDAAIGGDGVFLIRGLRPGDASVSIVLDGPSTAPPLSVDHVAVIAGETTRDARLQDVDLAALFSRLTIRAIDPEGRPVVGARACAFLGKSPWHGAPATDRDGRSVFLVPSERLGFGIDVMVRAEARRVVVLRGVTNDADAVLAPAIRTTVRVRLADDSPLPESPFLLAATLLWIEPGAGDDDRTVSETDPRDVGGIGDHVFSRDRSLAFTVTTPGRYRADVTLIRTVEHGAERIAGIGGPPKIVVVPEDGASAEAVVAIDPEDLARLTKR